ncbi:MAG: outer membrane protein assembly factor BamE [Pseudomonadales bacterium]|nr:outer membrane protein assembly factor BamE [Pseudomonadales bacterium]
MTRTFVLRLLALALAVAVSSCALPRVYKVTIQQGNVITQKMVDELKPGMTREQVAYIMGEPVIRNPFDESRWDYVYTLRVPGSVERQITMSLFFTDDVLSHFTGDLAPSDRQGDEENPDLASSE